MTAGQQRRTIAVSSMVVFSLGFLGAAHKDELPSARFLVGVGFTFMFISIFADLGAGDLAAGFAILIMISAVLYEGEDIMGLLTQRAKGEVKTKAGKKGKNKSEPVEGRVAGIGAPEGLEPLEDSAVGLDRPQPLQRSVRAQRATRLMRG
jgi:hypothetical protein